MSNSLWSRGCSMPNFSVFHYLPEFAQTNVHWVNDDIQPSHPLPPLSPFAFNLFQHQDLFQRVSSSSGGWRIGVSGSATVLPKDIQGWFPLGLTDLISLLSKGLLRVLSTTVQNHQFFGSHLSLWSNSHICTNVKNILDSKYKGNKNNLMGNLFNFIE